MSVIDTSLLLLVIVAGLSMLVTRRLRAVGLVLLLMSAGGIFFLMWQSSQRNAAFESIKLGTTAADVAAAIGDPPRVTDGTEWIEPGYKRSADELISGCVREYWYSSFLYPEKLSLCFDSSSRLIHKYRYVSW